MKEDYDGDGDGDEVTVAVVVRQTMVFDGAGRGRKLGEREKGGVLRHSSHAWPSSSFSCNLTILDLYPPLYSPKFFGLNLPPDLSDRCSQPTSELCNALCIEIFGCLSVPLSGTASAVETSSGCETIGRMELCRAATVA